MKIRNVNRLLKSLIALLLTFLIVSPVLSDPCGMVPPIYFGKGSPITRVGLQQTYVFLRHPTHSFIRPSSFKSRYRRTDV